MVWVGEKKKKELWGQPSSSGLIGKGGAYQDKSRGRVKRREGSRK